MYAEVHENYISFVVVLQPVLFVFCAGNELFFCSLYVLAFTQGYLGINYTWHGKTLYQLLHRHKKKLKDKMHHYCI